MPNCKVIDIDAGGAQAIDMQTVQMEVGSPMSIGCFLKESDDRGLQDNPEGIKLIEVFLKEGVGGSRCFNLSDVQTTPTFAKVAEAKHSIITDLERHDADSCAGCPTAKHGKQFDDDDELSCTTGVSGISVPSLRKDWEVTESQDAFKMKYSIWYVLGTGSFGDVFLATRVETGDKFAAKAVKTAETEAPALFKNEFEIAKCLNHPNIVKLHDVFFDGQMCYLVMEMCSGGDLLDFVRTHKEKTTGTYFQPDVQVLAKFMWQILQSIRYLHHYHIVHRDIKLENYLLDSASVYKARLKLTDFGLAAKIRPGQKLTDVMGSPGYVAPEVLNVEGDGYGRECDVWSVGVCIYIIFSGFFPIPITEENSGDDLEMYQLTMRHDIVYKHKGDKDYHKDIISILCMLLQKDPSERSSARQVLSTNSWLRNKGRGKTDHCCTVS